MTGDQLKQVLQEMRGKLTPEEGRAFVGRALRDRDQADSDKWQVLQHHTRALFWLVCRIYDPTYVDQDTSGVHLAANLLLRVSPMRLETLHAMH